LRSEDTFQINTPVVFFFYVVKSISTESVHSKKEKFLEDTLNLCKRVLLLVNFITSTNDLDDLSMTQIKSLRGSKLTSLSLKNKKHMNMQTKMQQQYEQDFKLRHE